MNSRDPILASAIRLARRLERESAEVGRTRYTLLSRVLMLASSSILDAVGDEMSIANHDDAQDNRDADLSHELFPEGYFNAGRA